MFALDQPAMPDLAALLAAASSRPSLPEMGGAPVEAFLAVLGRALNGGAAMPATAAAMPDGKSPSPPDDAVDAREAVDSTPVPSASPPVVLPSPVSVVPAASIVPDAEEPGPVPSEPAAAAPLRAPPALVAATSVASTPAAKGVAEPPMPKAAAPPQPSAAVPAVTPLPARADTRPKAPVPPPVLHASAAAPPMPSASPDPGVAMPAPAGRAASAPGPTLDDEGASSSVPDAGEATAARETERLAERPSLSAPDVAVPRDRPARTSTEPAEASLLPKAAPDTTAPQVTTPAAPVVAAASHPSAAVPANAVPSAAAPVPPPHTQIVRALAPFAPEQRPGPPAVLSIRLEPADLGQVEVRIEPARDGMMRVEIVAERPETIALLHRDQHDLLRALDRAGLSTHEPPTLSFAGSAGGSAERHAAERQPRHQPQGQHTPDLPPAGDTPAAVPALPMLRAAGHIDLIA